MAASPLAGLLLPTARAGVSTINGDWTICGTEEYWDTVFEVDGDVLVGSAAGCAPNPAGNLIIHRGGIRVVQDQTTIHTVTIQGSLTLDESVLTTITNQVTPYVALAVTVSGTLTATSSTLKFPGSFTVNAPAQVTLTDSTVTGFGSSELPFGTGTLAEDQNDDAPGIVVTGGSVFAVRSTVDRLWESNTNPPSAGVSAASQIILTGGSMTLFDTFVSADYAADDLTHNYFNLSGTSRLYAYGLTILPNPPRDRTAILTQGGSEASILRFLDALVLDENGVPVQNANMDAEWSRTGVTATYPEAGAPSPTAAIQALLPQTPWDRTGADGRALIPLWTDTINAASQPNSLVQGDFNVTATAPATPPGCSTPLPQQLNLSFAVYPDLYAANNTESLTFSIPNCQLPQPDLIVESITFNTTTPLEGWNVTATITIRNQGTGGATSVLVKTFKNLVLAEPPRTIGFLGPGASSTFVLTFANVAAGQHNVQVVVDPDNAVRETVETNNALTQAFAATPLGPDLAVSINAGPAYSGSPVNLSAVITNVGDRATTFQVRIDFYRDSTQNLIVSDSVPVLGAGASTSISIEWLPPFDGAFTIIVIVDPLNQLSEPLPYLKSNNQDTVAFSTILVPNLRIEAADLTLSDPFPTAGTGIPMRVTVRNVGKVAAPAFTLRFLRDGTTLEDQLLAGGLGAGASVTRTSVQTVNFGTCGLRTIGAIADVSDVVPEGSAQEADNAVTNTVQVFPGGPGNVTAYPLTYPDVTADFQTTKSWDITGEVTIRGASVTFVQGEDLCDKHFIKVRAGGVLRLEDATIRSNLKFVIYVELGAQLVVQGSRLLLDGPDGSGILYVGNGGIAALTDATLDGDLVAAGATTSFTAKRTSFSGASVHVDTQTTTRLWDPTFSTSVSTLSLVSDDGNSGTLDFDIRNATFSASLTAQLEFRGRQWAQLTSVQLSKSGNWWEGMIEGSAKVSRYWWLEVRAVDGTRTFVPDAEIGLEVWNEPSLDWVAVPPVAVDDLYYAQPPVTGFPVIASGGFIAYRAKSEDRFAGSPHWSNATYLASGRVVLVVPHYPDANLSALVTADTVIELVFSELTPDFEVLTITFSGMNGNNTDEQPVNTEILITVVVHNNGNIDTQNVTVYAYRTNIDVDNDNMIDAGVSDVFLVDYVEGVAIPADDNVTVVLRWTPTSLEAPPIWIAADRFNSTPETNEANNLQARCCLQIFGWPDAEVGPGDVRTFTPVEDNMGFVEVTVHNLGAGPTQTGVVQLLEGQPPVLVSTASFGVIDPNRDIQVNLTWTPQSNGLVTLTAKVIVNYPLTQPQYRDYDLTNNEVQAPQFVLTRPDLFLDDLDYATGDLNFSRGSPRSFQVLVHNLGTTPARDVLVAVYLVDLVGGPAVLLATATVAVVNGSEFATVTVTGIMIDADPGSRFLRLSADPLDTIVELVEDNNEATVPIQVRLPLVTVTLSSPPDGVSIELGRSPAVEGRVIIQGTSLVVADAEVVVTLEDALGVRQANGSVRTDADGFFAVGIFIPETLTPGTYRIVATVQGATPAQDFAQVNIVAPQGPGFPLWLLLLIVIIIVAGIAGVVAYTKFYGLGKMVECGNCGTFIPEDAAKCPNCNVEFEKDMAKCSNCQSWIPIDVKSCPECGVEFTTGEVEVQAYQDKMKLQYNEFVARIRRDGDAAAGKKLSDKEFQGWWVTQPTFMTFEDWLREEEEQRKLGSRACPNCQTLNSVTAKVCHRCGTLLEVPKDKKPPAKPPTAGAPKATPPVQPVPAKGPAQPPAGGFPPPPGAGPSAAPGEFPPPAAPLQRKVVRRPVGPEQPAEPQFPPPTQPVPRKVVKPGEEEKSEGGEGSS